MRIIPHQQGTQDWLDARKGCDTASEAPAAAGVSKYQKRQDPITAMVEIEGIKLLASLDGLTMDESIAFEHKLYSESLAEQVRAGNLDPHYTVQMDQQCLVVGAKKVLFMTSNGTKEKMEWCWYEPTAASKAAVIDTWKQFHKDLAAYVPEPVTEKAVAAEVEAFPVPSIQVKGELVACNLSEITPKFDKYLAETKTELVTDQDFADGEANAKASREAAKNLKLTAKAVIDQITPISEAVRTLEGYAVKFDALGLKLEKAVKSQKDLIKTSAIMKAKQDLDAHVAELESEIKPIRMNLPLVDFAGAISGVKTIASMQERINNALLTAKMDADAMARDIRAKLAWCKEHAEGFGMLFPDLQQIIGKAMDDFQLVIKSRIDEHKRAEAEKEEKIKAEAEEAARQKIAAEAAKASIPEGHGITQDEIKKSIHVIDKAFGSDVKHADASARIKLGDINAALGFMVTADFLASIGWEPVAKERNSIMYREVDFQAICESLVEHIVAVAGSYDFKKAA